MLWKVQSRVRFYRSAQSRCTVNESQKITLCRVRKPWPPDKFGTVVIREGTGLMVGAVPV